MKKIITLVTLFGLSTFSVAQGFHENNQPNSSLDKYAKHPIQQGFYDETSAVKTVKDALNAPDNSFIVIEGKIIKQVGKDDFIFQDATGEMEIEVSRKAWNHQTITPQDTIQIYGKVDKDWGKTEIEVKRIVKK